MITKEKWAALRQLMVSLDIREEDLTERFILGSGSGGQNLHKTHSCVYLKHRPSDVEIKCQKTRLRDDNRYFARKRLCEKIDEQMHQTRSDVQQAIEKIRRQKRRRSRKAKQKMLEDKHHRGQIKDSRKKHSGGSDAE